MIPESARLEKSFGITCKTWFQVFFMPKKGHFTLQIYKHILKKNIFGLFFSKYG
jgi:hypothetical protein